MTLIISPWQGLFVVIAAVVSLALVPGFWGKLALLTAAFFMGVLENARFHRRIQALQFDPKFERRLRFSGFVGEAGEIFLILWVLAR